MQISSRLASFRNLQSHKELPAKRQRSKFRERWLPASYKVPSVSKRDEYDDFFFVSDVCYVEIDGKDDFRSYILAPIEDMPSREALMFWLEVTKGLGPTEALSLRPQLRSPGVSRARSLLKRHPARVRVSFAKKLKSAVKKVFKPAFKRQRTKISERSYEYPSDPVHDEMLSLWLHANGGTEIPADEVSAAAFFFGMASDSSATTSAPSISSGRLPSRVRFADNPVTAVVEIPSHRSLTEEEKRCLYRDNRNLEAEVEAGRLERRFDRSRRCHNNALEEIMFFRNHLGELVHPAHFEAYVHDDLPGLSLDSVPGFASFDEYMDYLNLYTRFYEKSVREKRFRPQKR